MEIVKYSPLFIMAGLAGLGAWEFFTLPPEQQEMAVQTFIGLLAISLFASYAVIKDGTRFR